MGELTKAEWETLFHRALAWVGQGFQNQAMGGGPPDPVAIAQAMRDRTTVPAGTLYRDLLTIARRAVRAGEAASELRANPDRGPLAADIPGNRGIYASQSRYQYVVIVGTSGAGRSGPQGFRVIFGSNSRLTLDQVQRRAASIYSQTPTAALAQYDASIRYGGAGPQTTYTVIAISQYEAI